MAFQSGNKGRIREKIAFDALMLEMKAAPDVLGARPIARKLLFMAAEGDIQAIKEVFNRLDGMPVQQQDVNVNDTRTVVRAPMEESIEEWKQRVRQTYLSGGSRNEVPKLNS